jgi:hypothetical protein
MIYHYPPVTETPYGLLAAQGKLEGVTPLYITGHSENITATRSTIWPKGTAYSFLTAATTMTLSSSNAGDTTGQVFIEGLDSNYDPISETLTLNGQTAVTTTNSYLRINKLTVVANGIVGNVSLGTGTVTSGVPANTYGYIAATEDNSLSSVYTVPNGYTYYLTHGTISVGAATGGQSLTGYLHARINGIDYITAKTVMSTGYQAYPYDPPVVLPEKADIYADATASGSTLACSISFNGYLIKNT